MTLWPFWLGGLALAAVMVGHWLLVGRLMAVSGRYSKLVDAFRWGAPKETPQLSEADLLAAMQAATLAEFGDQAKELLEAAAKEAEPEPAPEPDPEPDPAPVPAVSASRQPLWLHVLFFASLAVGGLVSELAAGGLHPAFTLRGDLAAKVLGDGPVRLGLLLLGGVLVGFGTRMAGGCTSGHGLCGLSRLQKGSILSTACFFGAGIGVGFLLRGLA